MKLDRHLLQVALEIVRPGLANKEIIEQANAFAFLEDRVVTYNDEISLSHPIPDLNLTGSVRAEELYTFVKSAKNKDLLMKVEENELLLKAGKSKAGLALKSEIKLPLNEVNDVKDWQDLPEEFSNNLMFVKDHASKDMTRPVLTNVHVNKKGMETSDGFQIMRVFQEGWPFEDYLIPAEHVPDIHKIEPVQVAKSSGWLHFRNMNDTEISVRVMNDSYVNTDDHFDVKGHSLIFPDNMTDILERTIPFTRREHELDEEMEIKIKDNKLLVHGNNDYGWFKEQASVQFNGDAASFWIAPKLLKNILSRSNECILGSEKIRFSEEDWEYVAVLKQN